MKCPRCGYEPNELEALPDTIWIVVREMKIGYTKSIPKTQLRKWQSLQWIFRTLRGAIACCPLVEDDVIFQCKRLGTKEELKSNPDAIINLDPGSMVKDEP